MRPVALPPPPPANSSTDAKLKWCIEAITKIATASKADDPNAYADAYAIANITEQRTLDVASGTLADVRKVLGTFLQDHKKRGSKRTE